LIDLEQAAGRNADGASIEAAAVWRCGWDPCGMGEGGLSSEWTDLDGRVLALLNAGRKEEYLAMTEELVKESGEDARVRMHYANALSLLKPEQAPHEIRTAVALAPNDPVILTNAASRMFELGHFEESQKYASRAGDLVKLSEFVLGSDLVHLAGRLADHQGDTERARALLKAAADVGPEDRSHARRAKEFARFLARQGEADPAREVVRAALAAHPDDEELRQMSITDPPLPESSTTGSRV
jgi:tetratricopeptide (TPR) repeat protein